MKWAIRGWKIIREMAWIVGFMVLVLPAITKSKLFSQEPERHSIRASVRPNDSTKYVPSLPWVSEYEPPPIYEQWWKDIAACENLPYPGELTKRVTWIQINSRTFRLGSRPGNTFGFTDEPHLTIYVAIASQLEPEVILHEMAHQLD